MKWVALMLLLGSTAIGVASVVAQKPEASNQKPQHHASSSAATSQRAAPERGAEVFEQNCSRCHNAPQGFSSHISGTIATHMRVRANLSDRDYKALLHFLNP